MNTAEITFFISSKIALHTALPYISDLKQRNTGIHYVVSDDIVSDVQAITAPEDTVARIIDYDRKNKFAKNMHKLLVLLITPSDYSQIYQKLLSRRFDDTNPFLAALLKFFMFITPSVERRNVNRIVKKIIERLITHKLPTEKIIAVTIPVSPYLLCGKEQKVYSIMESWDHPAKWPLGYVSKKVFLWNKNLGNDWAFCQADTDIDYAYPIKLLYAIKAENKGESSENIMMYPAITSKCSDSDRYEEEIRFMEMLVSVEGGQKLLIKPKPNTVIGDLDYFTKYDNVVIGSYQENNGRSSYGLSDEYNNKRIEELSRCTSVLNLGTTFAFDAAAFGLPVIQLKFNCPKQFPIFSNFETFPHLHNHLFNRQELIFEITDDDSVANQLKKILSDPETIIKAERFRDYLVSWLIPEDTSECSVSEVVEKIIRD